MKTYLILFRGINVGGKNIVPMKELVTLLENNHYKKVRTYIQSGNVLLQSPKKPSQEISAMIKAKFGFEPEILVLDETGLNASIANCPYKVVNGKSLHFFFCKKSPKMDTEKLQKYKSSTEEYFYRDKVFYLHAPDGIGRSKLVANIEACLGVPVTGRNFNTMTQLQQMIKDT